MMCIAYRLRSTLLVRPAQGGEERVLLREGAYPDSTSTRRAAW